MVIDLIIFLISIMAIVFGANLFVRAGSRIARKFGVSQFVVGLTLFAFGTSLPELFSSVIASVQGQSGLVIGTILGANIANLTLIIGTAALISGKIKLDKEVLKRDIFMLVLVIVMLSIFLFDGVLSLTEGLVLLVLFAGYNLFLFDSKLKLQREYHFREFFKNLVSLNLFRFKRKEWAMKRTISVKDFLILVIGGVLLFAGAEYLVKESVFLAGYFGIHIVLIGILISIGTTMPEMSIAIISARKNHGEISVGNSIGSVITNSLLVLGVSAVILPLAVMKNTFYFMIPFLLFSSLILAFFIRTKFKVTRAEGFVLLLIYVLFLVLSFRVL